MKYSKPILSDSSVWKLIREGQDCGLIWMSETELKRNFKWSPKQLAWVNRKNPSKKVRAV